MPEKPFPAYEGDQPYFFVTYSHSDAEIVYPEMQWIHAAGFHLWYDDGIHVGAVWRHALVDALLGSTALIFMRTANSVVSDYCTRELHFALDEHRPILTVQLTPSELPPVLRLSIGDRQDLVKAELEEAVYRSRFRNALDTCLHTAARPRSLRRSRGGTAGQSEMAVQVPTGHVGRILLCTVAVLETISRNGSISPHLIAEINAAGGEVVTISGRTVIASFDSAARALAMLRRASDVYRAGASCGDVLYENGMVHGTALIEAEALLKVATPHQLLLANRLAALSGVAEAVSAASSSLISGINELPKGLVSFEVTPT